MRAGSTIFAICLTALASGCGAIKDSLNEKALYPRPDYEVWPEDEGLPAEDVFVPSDGLRLHGWLFKAKEASGTIVVFHGNYPNASPFMLWVPSLFEAGYNVLLVNFRGFGLSEGKADCWSLGRDGRAIVKWIATRPELAKLPIGIIGVSLGTMVALSVADACPEVKAVVLDAPFLPRIKIDQVFGSFLGALAAPVILPGELDSDSIASRLETPVFAIHGARDRIAEPFSSVELMRRARGEHFLWMVPGAGHSPHVAGLREGVYFRQIRRFLDVFLRGERGRPLVAASFDSRETAAGTSVTVHLEARGGDASGPLPVELCLSYHKPGTPQEAPAFVWTRRTWTPGATIELQVPGEPLVASAIALDAEDATIEGETWEPRPTPDAKAVRALEELRLVDWNRLFGTGTSLTDGDLKARQKVEADVLAATEPPLAPLVAPGFIEVVTFLANEHAKAGEVDAERRLLERAVTLASKDDPYRCRVLGDASWSLRTPTDKLAASWWNLAKLETDERARTQDEQNARDLVARDAADARRGGERAASVVHRLQIARSGTSVDGK